MRCRHVDERVPDIALVLEVDRQVEEVERVRVDARKPLLQQRQQHLLGVLVGDVLDHEGRALVLAPRNLVQVQPVHPVLMRLALCLGRRRHLVARQPATQRRIGVVPTRRVILRRKAGRR